MAERRKSAPRRAGDTELAEMRVRLDEVSKDVAAAAQMAAQATASAAQALQAGVAHERVCLEQHRGMMTAIQAVDAKVDTLSEQFGGQIRDLIGVQRQAFVGAFTVAIGIIGSLAWIILKLSGLPV